MSNDKPARMNAAQLKYARELLDKAYRARSTSITAKHTQLGVKLTRAQKEVALCEGHFTINNAASYPDRTDPWLSDIVLFDDETETVVDEVAIGVEAEALRVEYEQITQELVLGSGSDALKLIRQFAEGPTGAEQA